MDTAGRPVNGRTTHGRAVGGPSLLLCEADAVDSANGDGTLSEDCDEGTPNRSWDDDGDGDGDGKLSSLYDDGGELNALQSL